jgi:hypothetical protein
MSANIINCHYRFGLEPFKGISYEAKELIKQLLVANSKDRIPASQCITSNWIRQVSGALNIGLIFFTSY